ncbi:hypothetical protein AVANS14531_08100 [Campylobacter sp. Cr9]|uniref:hypothetical protein n=1 Tax=Campylobacter sp. Cr9 TaxID=2735728 RepID=UPI003014543C|nr:hypothetical protein [Campylobacter sp. Cr9]
MNYLDRTKLSVETRLAREIKNELAIKGVASKVAKKLLGFFTQNKLNICEYQAKNNFSIHQVLKAEKLISTDLMILFNDEIFIENISSLKPSENIENHMFSAIKRLFA